MEVDRNKNNHLITISPSGDSNLTAALTRAITNAESAADAAYQIHLGKFARRGPRQGLRAIHEGGGAEGAEGGVEDVGAPKDKPPPDEGGRCALTHVRVGDPRDEPPPEEGGGVPSPRYGWGAKKRPI